jgi:hypothetical protein
MDWEDPIDTGTYHELILQSGSAWAVPQSDAVKVRACFCALLPQERGGGHPGLLGPEAPDFWQSLTALSSDIFGSGGPGGQQAQAQAQPAQQQAQQQQSFVQQCARRSPERVSSPEGSRASAATRQGRRPRRREGRVPASEASPAAHAPAPADSDASAQTAAAQVCRLPAG